MKDKSFSTINNTRWQRKAQSKSLSYNGYTVLMVTNLSHDHPSHPPQVVYEGDNGKVWSLDLSKWPGNLEPETKENFKKVPVIIDLEKETWFRIKTAALKSNWIPSQYFINDWVADVCNFLTYGHKQSFNKKCMYSSNCEIEEKDICFDSEKCFKFEPR